jgi:site-specific recombinase XerD
MPMEPHVPSIDAAMQTYLESLAGKSPRTQATYGSALRRLEEFLDGAGYPTATTPTLALPADALERFYAWLVGVYGRERRPTIVTYIGGARSFFRWLARRRLGPAESSFEQVKAGLQEVMGRTTYRTPRIDGRLHQIIQYVEALPLPPGDHSNQRLATLRDKAMLRALFGSGMRRAELVSLDRADLDDGWADQALIRGKGERERIVFFDEPTLVLIRAYLAARGDRYRPLFLRHNRNTGRPGAGGVNLRLSPQSVWLAVKRYAALAGVPATTHDFRHAKASLLLNRGAKLSEVQDLLGHASPETTKRIYAHYEVSHLREAFDRFSASPDELAAALVRKRAGP